MFWLQGALEFFDDNGNHIETLDVFWFINHYVSHCKANGSRSTKRCSSRRDHRALILALITAQRLSLRTTRTPSARAASNASGDSTERAYAPPAAAAIPA